MNRDQADALARFLHLCRPEWDHPGIMRALGDAKAGDPLNVALAAIRWTANPDLRTPGGMGRPGEHWTERVVTATPRPPRADEACRTCGRALHAPDAICSEPTRRPPAAAPPTDGYRLAREANNRTTQTEETP